MHACLQANGRKFVPSNSLKFIFFFTPEGATDSARKDFLSEAQMLAAFDHSNVMGLLKVVTKSEPVLVIIPFMVNGDLKHYLKRWGSLHMHCVDG